MRIKICGITNEEDALKVVHYGAWAVGFVFDKKSPRYVSPSKARKIVEALPPFVTPVGVFVNQKERAVRDICQFVRLQTLQFHGDEEPAYCKRFKDYKIMKAFRIRDDFDFAVLEQYKVDAYVFDAYQDNAFGGTGTTFNWHLIQPKQIKRPFILSGGLSAGNILQALETLKTYAVDVSSGVERSPGLKNHALVKEFLETIS